MHDMDALKKTIADGGLDETLATLYGTQDDMLRRQRARYQQALDAFCETFGSGRQVDIYSAPGRTEIGGNHTDHNNGIVFAAAVNLDIIAVVAKSGEPVIRVKSKGFDKTDAVGLDTLEPQQAERDRSASLIRGVAAGIKKRGGQVQGFDAYTTNDVLKGSGLSSSAAFEVCMAEAINGLYNGGRFGAVELAMVSQYAENVYFGKPSGLMDQTASAVGSAVKIDFVDTSAPVVEKVPLDLAANGYCLVVTDTKGDHADLTPDYAAIRGEMESVAACFGKRVLREVDESAFLKEIPRVRQQAGDRAVLRAIHFFGECRRAAALADAAAKNDMDVFLKTILEGGHSSYEYNQNAYSPARPEHQGLSIGLALSQLALGTGGAWRLQGGGFAGTIQAFVPAGRLNAYKQALEGVFGAGACYVLNIRPVGSVCVTK